MKTAAEYKQLLDETKDAQQMRRLLSALLADFDALHVAIAKHMAQTGHNLCWENDLELWKTIAPQVAYPHPSLPPEKEFEQRCKEYYLSRVCETRKDCADK